MAKRRGQESPMQTINDSSFDDVGGHLHDQGHGKAERLCGAEVDQKLKFRRLFDRNIARLLALQNLVGISCGPMARLDLVGPVGHEGAMLKGLFRIGA